MYVWSMKLHMLYEGKVQVTPKYTMKADTGNKDIAPHTFFNLGA
jgi:hypothetical protein